MELHGQQKNRDEVQKEVLAALFNASERSEEYPRRIVKDRSKCLPSWQVVGEPPEELMEEYQTEINYSQRENTDGTALSCLWGDQFSIFMVLFLFWGSTL